MADKFTPECPQATQHSDSLVSCNLPTEFGQFKLHAMPDRIEGGELIALTMGDVGSGESVLTRLHSECLTGDVFHSRRCDCGAQLNAAMALISKKGRGAIIYLRQEGRGIGLINKIKAYDLQEAGIDTVDANRLLGFADDLREYDGAKRILSAMNISSVNLLTNNPAKVTALRALGIEVIERIPLHEGKNSENEAYIEAKEKKMGHWRLDGEI